ncbi:MAG TPA: energy transducer TonB, partial [Acidobacteriota bacterium]|nr:energy transducer TonB [Acidobacteriota bacterium]
FPMMMFGSVIAHLVLLTLMLALPALLPAGKKEPFGGPTGGGLNVVGVVDFNLGKKGPQAPKLTTQEEPAPSIYLQKAKEKTEPLESKTSFPEEKKKVKEQPADTSSRNVPMSQRKLEGPYGAGTDKSKQAGKSGSQGAGQFGLGTFGAGQGGPGGYGTGAGVAFPFPWYVENVITKIELSWSRPYIQETTPTVYECVVYFVITRTGQVQSLQVEKSSGIAALDRSAESAVLGASPLPPLPTQWTEPDLPFRLTFSYSRQ